MRLRRVAVLLLLGAPSLLPQAPSARNPPAGTPPAGTQPAAAADRPSIWIDVPFSAQTSDGCGSSSISMVMQYWDGKQNLPVPSSADANVIQAALFSHRAGGIFATSMQHYFLKSGYRAFAFQGQWSDLEHHLALGRPLIAAIEPSSRLEPFHYVVVVGIDPARGYLFLNDPAQQKMLRISRAGFEAEWRPTRNWTLLAVPQPAP